MMLNFAVVDRGGVIAVKGPIVIGPSGLVRLLPEWTCDDSLFIHMLHRPSGRMSARVQAFVGFCKEAFADFDPGDATVLHEVQARTRVRPVR